MTDERCIHELILGRCADCAPIPRGLTKMVYVTKGGSVFHRQPDCSALLEGQRKALRFGQQIHDPLPVTLRDAESAGRGACILCFPDYVPPGAKPCSVRHGAQWLPGLLLEWHRSGEGRWSGVVGYVVEGEVRTERRDQDDLRPR